MGLELSEKDSDVYNSHFSFKAVVSLGQGGHGIE